MREMEVPGSSYRDPTWYLVFERWRALRDRRAGCQGKSVMALFDGITSEIAAKFGLGPAAAPLVTEVVTVVAGGPGGLGGFVDRVHASGLGPHVSAWLNGTPGHELSKSGLEQLLGGAAIAGMARRVGLSIDTLSSVVSQILPRILRLLAPGGVPAPEAATAVAGLIGTTGPLLAEPITARPAYAGPQKAPPMYLSAVPDANPFKVSLPIAGMIAVLALFVATAWPYRPPVGPPTQAPTAASRLWISNDNGTAVVSGSVPDGATRYRIADSLRNIFGADKTKANIVVDPTVGPAPWLNTVAGAFPKLKTNGVSALFDGDTISLGGLASDADRDSLIAALRGLFGAGVSFGTLTDRVGDLVAGSTRQAAAALASLGAGFTAAELANALNQAIINFDTASANLPPGAVSLLTSAAAKLKTLPAGTVIEIAGFTDATGDAAANLALSQQRADAVRAQLVTSGVPAAMLVAKGYGSADPVASNETPVGRFRNRRIEYRVVAPG